MREVLFLFIANARFHLEDFDGARRGERIKEQRSTRARDFSLFPELHLLRINKGSVTLRCRKAGATFSSLSSSRGLLFIHFWINSYPSRRPLARRRRSFSKVDHRRSLSQSCHACCSSGTSNEKVMRNTFWEIILCHQGGDWRRAAGAERDSLTSLSLERSLRRRISSFDLVNVCSPRRKVRIRRGARAPGTRGDIRPRPLSLIYAKVSCCKSISCYFSLLIFPLEQIT
jgi:hypothetical protein